MNKGTSEDLKILLTGVPGASESPYPMNFAQAPQGPTLKGTLPIPDSIREKINRVLEHFFNPQDTMPYSGMHLIEQNLRKDFPESEVIVKDHPKEAEILKMVEETWFDIVGVSIGSEPLIPRARIFAENIQERSQDPDTKIVFGNYGAASAKVSGSIDESYGEILWNSPEERDSLAKAEKSFFTGEGVHDMRLYLQRMGVPMDGSPESPVISKMVAQNGLKSSHPFFKKLAEQCGLRLPQRRTGALNLALGCPNRCYFCNTSKLFGEKKEFFKNEQDIFEEICRYMDGNEGTTEDDMPGLSVILMDENFTKDMKCLVGLCANIRESHRDIRLTVFGDISGLYRYFQEHGNFIDLARGGLSAVWLGIESRADIFQKRGGASTEDVEEIVKALQDVGIIVIGSFIVGLSSHTEEEDQRAEDGTLIQSNIHEDFQWSRNLRTGGYQVVVNGWTYLTNPDLAEPIGPHTDKTWGHQILNSRHTHPHIAAERLGQLDRKFRELAYRENGPMSIRSLLILWDGYRNFKDSSDPDDLRMANYYYWMCKYFSDPVTFGTAFSTLPIFERHSEAYLQRMGAFFDEIDSASPPSYDKGGEYAEIFHKFNLNENLFVRFAAKKLRKMMSGRWCK